MSEDGTVRILAAIGELHTGIGQLETRIGQQLEARIGQLRTDLTGEVGSLKAALVAKVAKMRAAIMEGLDRQEAGLDSIQELLRTRVERA